MAGLRRVHPRSYPVQPPPIAEVKDLGVISPVSLTSVLATGSDDRYARARQRRLPKVNAAMVRTMGTDLLTVRIDLIPAESSSRD
jgi:hypothetical protein